MHRVVHLWCHAGAALPGSKWLLSNAPGHHHEAASSLPQAQSSALICICFLAFLP